MSSTTSNPIATITNNSGYDVDIYDVFNPSTDPKTPGPVTYTLLATVPNGATAQQVQTIRLASQLQAMFTGNITTLNNNYYQQFPVAVLAVFNFSASNAFTITSDMQKSMVDSFKFIKYVQANPSSQLATKFRIALGDKKSQKDAVNKFFESTGSFKLCTMTTWTAVFTWQGQFTNPWQGTYYLYSLGSSSAGSTSGSSAPALVATLAIKSSAADNTAVLTMEGTNNENTPVMMAGDGTMQEQNQGTGNLSVVLKPTWLNVDQTSQQDGKTVSKYAIGAAFLGTINEVKVAGNLNKLAIPKSSDTSKNAKTKNSANSFSLNTISTVLNLLIQAGMLYFMAKGYSLSKMQNENKAREKATSEADARARESQVEADYQENDIPRVRNMSESVESTVSEVRQGYRRVLQAQDIQNRQDTAREQITQLEEVLEGGAPSQATEDAAENLQKAIDKLEEATDPAMSADDRDAAMSDADTLLTDTSTNLQKELQDGGSRLSQEEEKWQRDTKDAVDSVKEQAKAQEENQRNQEEQENNDVDEPVDDSQFEDPDPVDAPPFEGGVE